MLITLALKSHFTPKWKLFLLTWKFQVDLKTQTDLRKRNEFQVDLSFILPASCECSKGFDHRPKWVSNRSETQTGLSLPMWGHSYLLFLKSPKISWCCIFCSMLVGVNDDDKRHDNFQICVANVSLWSLECHHDLSIYNCNVQNLSNRYYAQVGLVVGKFTNSSNGNDTNKRKKNLKSILVPNHCKRT